MNNFIFHETASDRKLSKIVNFNPLSKEGTMTESAVDCVTELKQKFERLKDQLEKDKAFAKVSEIQSKKLLKKQSF